MRTQPSKGYYLYHITHISNLPSILKYGLLPRAKVEATIKCFTDIADPSILADREHHVLPLSEYVPFHFFAKNPFDGAVCSRFGAENMVIIAVPRILHESEALYIIPTHPLHQVTPEIYSYEEGFPLVRWNILDSEYPIRDYHDPEIKNACMAECLIPRAIKPEEFSALFLPNCAAKSFLTQIPESCRLTNCRININEAMFP